MSHHIIVSIGVWLFVVFWLFSVFWQFMTRRKHGAFNTFVVEMPVTSSTDVVHRF